MSTTSVLARPEVTPPGTWTFPRGRTVVLANGLTVTAVHLPGKQIAAVKLVCGFGLADEPAELEGVGNITFAAVKDGTGSYDATGLSAAWSRLGANFRTSFGQFSSTFSMDAPLVEVEAALDLLAKVVLRPAFPTNSIDWRVKARLDGITGERTNPAFRASLELAKIWWPATSRWSRPRGGTAETVARIDRAAVEAFYAHHLDPTQSTLVIAGDLSELPVESLVEKCFAGWAPGGPAAPPVPASQFVAGPCVLIVDRPGSVQTQLQLVAPAVSRTHPDVPSIRIAAAALGGGTGSRIMAVLREQKGYTYGIGVSASSGRHTGTFSMSGAVHTPVTGAALDDLLAILGDFATGGIREDEHRAALQAAAGRVSMQSDSAQSIAGAVAGLVADGLPEDFIDQENAAVQATTIEGINAAYARSVDMDRAVLVAVGDGSVITEPLTSAGLGPVTVIPM